MSWPSRGYRSGFLSRRPAIPHIRLCSNPLNRPWPVYSIAPGQRLVARRLTRSARLGTRAKLGAAPSTVPGSLTERLLCRPHHVCVPAANQTRLWCDRVASQIAVSGIAPGEGEAVEGKDGVHGRAARLAGLAGLLDRFLLPLVLISAGLGIALPGPGRRVDATGAILITLAVLVFCTGMSVTFADISGLRTASRRIVLVLVATSVTLPVLAWLASRLVGEPMPRSGVLAAGVAPVEVASVAFTGLAGGEVAIAAGLLVASTLLTVLLAGPILALLGAHAATSQLGLLLTLALVVALPLVAGCVLRTIDPFGGRERPLIEILGT